MEHLRQELERLLQAAPSAVAVRERLANLVSVYPFNEFEYIISNLLGVDVLTLDEYQQLRDEYISRNMSWRTPQCSGPSTPVARGPAAHRGRSAHRRGPTRGGQRSHPD
jgi:hypothetical protein